MMNILVLTFGNRLLEDYYLKHLNKILCDEDISVSHLDVLQAEHNAYLRKFEYDKSNSLALRLKGLVPASDVAVQDIYKHICDKSIDMILCLGCELLWYIDSLFKNFSVDIAVVCAFADCDGLNVNHEFVSEYLVISDDDKHSLTKLGVPANKICVCGLIGSENFIPKFDARAEILLYSENDVCVFITDGNDLENVAALFDKILVSSLKNMNFVVISKFNKNFCDIFNSRYERHSNIGALFSKKDMKLYISAADYVIVDSDTDDVMCALINNKPLIAVDKNSNKHDLMNFLDKRCLAVVKHENDDIIKGLKSLLNIDGLREYMLSSQREVININSDNIIKNDIINKIYIKKGNENEQQSSS